MHMEGSHVVYILVSNGFPNGMAATQRVKLLSKAMRLKGYRVTILCIRALERTPVENIEVRGNYEGIEFEYTPGTTIRNNSFMKRRWLEGKGLIVSVFRLLQFKQTGNLNCMYVWSATGKLTLTGCFYRALAMVLGVPLVVELNERPWSLQAKPSYLEKKVSPLLGVRGVVVISSFLKDWVCYEAQRISRNVEILYVPILVDPRETMSSDSLLHPVGPVLIFAAAPQYRETVRFLFEVMNSVVKKYPHCQLQITGVKDTDPAGRWLRSDKTSKSLEKNIQLMGYLTRTELLALYRHATALLVPLFQDATSQARFPTKLGEYLCSGRPVISNKVGELTSYLVDGDTAFLCDTDHPLEYAETICRTLADPIRADEVGLRGRATAISHFDYVLWAEAISAFLANLDQWRK